MTDAIALGALFLLSLFFPAYLADPSIAPAAPSSPLFAAVSVGGAAGVGGLLSLTGGAIWNFFFPYGPNGGILRLTGRWRSQFRATIGPTLGRYWELTAGRGWAEGDRSLIATAFLFYRDAPPSVLEWTRRRHTRFSTALSAVAAIVLGLIVGHLVVPVSNPVRLVIEIGFGLVAIGTLVSAFEQRREAVQMETYWFGLRTDNPTQAPDAKSA